MRPLLTHLGEYGRIKKAVLIQSAVGRHLELLEMTRDHHRKYAEQHGMDYWCIAGNPTTGKRAGWAKIPLLLAAIATGYEKAIWLDADAVVVRPDVNLARSCTTGIGMVRHPGPPHWNSGVMVVHATPEVARFLRIVDESPENDSAWMEQKRINDLAEEPSFRSLLEEIDIRYNSVPGCAVSDQPVVVAAHGRPMEERIRILTACLAKLRVAGNECDGPASREDFADFLNRRGLVGEAVEVGVFRGEFAKAFLDRWKGKILHLVDAWCHLPHRDISNVSDADHEQNLQQTKQNLVEHKHRYVIHRSTSADAVRCFQDDSLDFAYLDANHAYDAISEDIRLWYPKVKPGSVLAGHDCLDGELPEGDFGVKHAVTEFEEAMGIQAQITTKDRWPSWYVVKPLEAR